MYVCMYVSSIHAPASVASTVQYLSHLLNAVGEDVSDDNPLLRRRPQIHLDQNNVVEQHQVAYVCHLYKDTAVGKSSFIVTVLYLTVFMSM